MTNRSIHCGLGILTSLALAAGCSGDGGPAGSAEGDNVGESVEAVTAAATLLVDGDFSATSSTKGIVQTEIASNSALKLIVVGDMSYAAPYA